MDTNSKAYGGRIKSRSRVWRRTRRVSKLLEEWMRSYKPEDLFDTDGRLFPD